MKFLFTLITLFSLSSFSEVIFNNERSPAELILIIKHLEKYAPNELQDLRGKIKIINEDLKQASKKDIFFLIKSEVYKKILDNEYIKLKTNKVEITSKSVSHISKKLEQYKLIYSDFSKWIMLSIESDLESFMQDGFIDKAQNINRNNEALLKRKAELDLVLKYLAPWIDVFILTSPEEFNELITKTSKDLIDTLSKKSFIYQNFAKVSSEKSEKPLIGLSPVISEEPDSSKNVSQEKESLEAESSSRKLEAEKTTEKIDLDLEKASPLIDNLKDQEEEKKEWKPE